MISDTSSLDLYPLSSATSWHQISWRVVGIIVLSYRSKIWKTTGQSRCLLNVRAIRQNQSPFLCPERVILATLELQHLCVMSYRWPYLEDDIICDDFLYKCSPFLFYIHQEQAFGYLFMENGVCRVFFRLRTHCIVFLNVIYTCHASQCTKFLACSSIKILFRLQVKLTQVAYTVDVSNYK